MSGFGSDDRENSANNNELESYSNKKDSEKKRREQENYYIEELAMLISSQIPELSDSEDSSSAFDPSKLEKGSILQDTVDKLRKLNQDRQRDVQREEISSSRSFLPKEILGSLVLEALDGFMFIISNEGNIDFVSDNVFDYLCFSQEAFLAQKSIFNFIHIGDHARFRVNLEPETWKTWKRLPQNTVGRQGFDRSKVFNLRFKVNNEGVDETLEERQQRMDQYENMQVSAIVMSNSHETSDDPKSGLFCIARRISRNERSGLTPVEQFTTKCNRHTLEVQVVDTEGLPSLYKTNISSHVMGKKLPELVHPQDRPLMRQHIEGFVKNITDTSRVYRMVLPPPLNIIHVKTKTKDFRPQPGNSHPGYLMSTHNIIRENELQIEDLPAMRPELQSADQSPGQAVVPSLSTSDTIPLLLLECSQPSPLVQTLQSPIQSVASVSSAPSPSLSSSSDHPRSEMLEKLLSPPPPPSPRLAPRPGRVTPSNNSPSGNELLKELLRPKDNEQKSDNLCFNKSSSVSRPEETITIGQILNEKRYDNKDPPETSELLMQLRKPPQSVGRISHSELAALLKSPSGDLKRSSSSDEGPASKQVPSLEKLLSVRPDRIIPPPVPRKWSETPQEKLPRDIVIEKHKDAPSRNNNSRTSNVRSPGAGGPKTIVRNVPRLNVDVKSSVPSDNPPAAGVAQYSDDGDAAMIDLLTDPVFSKILDGVDLGVAEIDQINDHNLAKQKILEIEQSLKLVENYPASSVSQPQSQPPSSVSNSSLMIGPQQQQQQQQQQSPQFSSVIQQQPHHKILQQRIAGPPVSYQNIVSAPGPRSPSLGGTNMEELLKGIPPNVSIPTNSDQQPGGMAGPRAISALERQLSGSSNMTAGAAPGPGASRHLSGDAGLASLQPPAVQGYRNVGRHLSGDQMMSRRVSGDSSLSRFVVSSVPVSVHDNAGGQFVDTDQGINIIRTSAGTVNIRQQQSRAGQAIVRRAPGGRALSQEDLESFGLSIEVNSDFGPPNQQPGRPQQQQVVAGSPQFSSSVQLTSVPVSQLQFSPNVNSGQYVTVSSTAPAAAAGQPDPAAAGALQFTQFSPAAQGQPTAVVSSQFSPLANQLRNNSSPFSPPTSKQPFQF